MNVLWTPVNVMVKIATTSGLSPASVALIRWGILAVILFSALATPGFRRLSRATWPSRGDAVRAMVIGSLLFAPAHALYYIGLTKGASTVGGTVLNATSPIWTALLAFAVLRERASINRVAAIAVGFAGAWIVVAGFGVPRFGGDSLGNALYLGGVLAEATASVLTAQIILRSSGITVLAFEILGAVLSFLVLPHLIGESFALGFGTLNVGAVLSMGYLILVPGLICFGVWYVLIERAPLSLMVVSILMQPPLSAVLAWFALGERPTVPLYVGASLIVGALAVAATERTSVQAEGET